MSFAQFLIVFLLLSFKFLCIFWMQTFIVTFCNYFLPIYGFLDIHFSSNLSLQTIDQF